MTDGESEFEAMLARTLGERMIKIGDEEMLHRLLADGTNDGGPPAYHLMPAKVQS